MKNMKPNSLLRAAVLAATMLGAPAFAQDRAGPDIEKDWADFLAGARFETAMAAYDVLAEIGYVDASGEVDAEGCSEHKATLAAAVQAAPVSISLRRAAYLCADATGDKAATEDSLAYMVALSRNALRQAGDPAVSRPIRVLAPRDAMALLFSSGLDDIYEYYSLLHPSRFYPLVAVGWDDKVGIERHYAFDYVDALSTLRIDSPYQGKPVMRNSIAKSFVDSAAKGGTLAAIDAAAHAAASQESTLADKRAKLRFAATQGGVQSARTWLLMCAGNPEVRDCSDGLLDVLLGQAEKKQALPMVVLAFAYYEGIGTGADQESGWTLLDAAAKRWPEGAYAEFAGLWSGVHGDAALPAGVRERVEQAAQAGSRAARRFLILRKASAAKPQLDEADVSFLGSAEENGRGLGHGVLASYYDQRGEEKEKWQAMVRAAEAGDSASQAMYASVLLYGDGKRFANNESLGEEYARRAAQGGNAWSARVMAGRSMEAGDFGTAEGWLLGAAGSGDIDALMLLASLYLEARPGVSEGPQRAVEMYRMLATAGEGASARRALAELALKGEHGVVRDPAQALRWLKQDAERGDHDSELSLGGHYLQGDFGKVDEVEGTRWLQRAIKAGNEDAATSYASWLYYDKNTAESRARGMQLLADAHAAGNKGATNNYAWLLCTSPRAEVYDPKRGFEASKKLGAIETMPAGTLDTVAACYAANGDFARAVELQGRAAKQMSALATEKARKERNGKPFGFERRLDLYKAGARYEEVDRNE